MKVSACIMSFSRSGEAAGSATVLSQSPVMIDLYAELAKHGRLTLVGNDKNTEFVAGVLRTRGVGFVNIYDPRMAARYIDSCGSYAVVVSPRSMTAFTATRPINYGD